MHGPGNSPPSAALPQQAIHPCKPVTHVNRCLKLLVFVGRGEPPQQRQTAPLLDFTGTTHGRKCKDQVEQVVVVAREAAEEVGVVRCQLVSPSPLIAVVEQSVGALTQLQMRGLKLVIQRKPLHYHKYGLWTQ